jgi:tRNA dimethylallyltransferase
MDAKKILILGVTASGKGRLAFEMAKRIGAEIISVDSMKVYRRMDIGTAKPPKVAQEQVNYHLIDVAEPSESFSVAQFLDMTEIAVSQIQADKKSVIAVGGTALYIKALLYGLFDGPGTDEGIRDELCARAESGGLGQLHGQLVQVDPVAAERIHPNDAKRIIRALEVYQLTGKPISSFQNQFEAKQPRGDWMVFGLRDGRSGVGR